MAIDSNLVISALFIAFDVIAALLLRRAARLYMTEWKLSVKTSEVPDVPHLVFLCYLFNPITIASCAVFNISALSNMLIAFFFLA
uniref:G_PROTEIN_RECEP_F1_2 domain-containing protein n=1 Tax=Steinernema glaseri TaxID=37863 RepID=A0A1I7YAT2_9BILA